MWNTSFNESICHGFGVTCVNYHRLDLAFSILDKSLQIRGWKRLHVTKSVLQSHTALMAIPRKVHNGRSSLQERNLESSSSDILHIQLNGPSQDFGICQSIFNGISLVFEIENGNCKMLRCFSIKVSQRCRLEDCQTIYWQIGSNLLRFFFGGFHHFGGSWFRFRGRCHVRHNSRLWTSRSFNLFNSKGTPVPMFNGFQCNARPLILFFFLFIKVPFIRIDLLGPID
mmetsp:Transcript_32118/g.78046  ORF Transcript_32118/g.78046 Transcript_32118/m.78046 type:complete len:227 (-) Transcript_32118:1832-2512(-)